MIVKSDTEKQFRAVQIVGLISLPFEEMTVLDVGCGEGHISKEIANRAKNVVGYDIMESASWPTLMAAAPSGLLTFTADKKAVEAKKPYDCIVLYDVLDHIEREDPTSLMVWLSSLLAPEGRIFIRAHPWTARHGSHLYETGLNKAFVHLALTVDELAIAGFDVKPNLRIVRPMAAYEHIFRDAGLKVFDRKGHTDPVEPYFSGPLLERIIKVTWRGAIDPDAALKIMGNHFIDYHLARA